jgi:hypothetical protein
MYRLLTEIGSTASNHPRQQAIARRLSRRLTMDEGIAIEFDDVVAG